MRDKVKWYEMQIGDLASYTNNDIVLRVPGGWVVSIGNGTCFVPFVKPANSERSEQPASTEQPQPEIAHILKRISLLADECANDYYASDWKAVRFLLNDIKKAIDSSQLSGVR